MARPQRPVGQPLCSKGKDQHSRQAAPGNAGEAWAVGQRVPPTT